MDPLSGRPHFPPPTPEELERWKFPSVNPRPHLLPIQLPCFQRMIEPSIDPRSIARAAPETFVQGWTISAHIFPAAFPRHISLAGQYEIPPLAGPGEDAKKQWKKALFLLAQRVITEKVAVEGLAGEEGESIRSKARQASEGLWQSATRIRRAERASLNGRAKGATLVVTHANGFHKEASRLQRRIQSSDLSCAVMGASIQESNRARRTRERFVYRGNLGSGICRSRRHGFDQRKPRTQAT